MPQFLFFVVSSSSSFLPLLILAHLSFSLAVLKSPSGEATTGQHSQVPRTVRAHHIRRYSSVLSDSDSCTLRGTV